MYQSTILLENSQRKLINGHQGLHYGHQYDIHCMKTFFLEEIHSYSFHQNAVNVVHVIV